MDYLASMKMLFVGTNQKSILTVNIEEILALSGYKQSGIGSSFLDESIAFRGSEIDQSFRKRLQIGGGMDGLPFEEDDVADEDQTEKNRKIIEQAKLDESDPLKKIMDERN
jgi:hypothetical protein